jgi:phosphoribosyl 1,2-cyclic phosphodiesterase
VTIPSPTRNDFVRLIFLGTRGEIDIATRGHRRHSSLLVVHGKHRLIIDCGADWANKFESLRPSAILLTHAHPDHARGLRDGAPCPVYASSATLACLAAYPIHKKYQVRYRRPMRIEGFVVEAFPVIHSIRAPAVGYRISFGTNHFFYVPDLVAIREQSAALRSIQLYIGDGASIVRPLIRRSDSMLIGHAPICTQLGWCKKEDVPLAIFTHCGTQIVNADGRHVAAEIRQLGVTYGVETHLARDGQQWLMEAGIARRVK